MIASANPTMRTKLLEPNAVCHHRSLFCPEYDDCLEIAVSGGWPSWSCEHCPVAASTTRPLMLVHAASAGSDTSPDEPLSVVMQ
jgi:hypothetical protein